MYSETDLDDAVQAGVLSEQSVTAFRAHIASSRATPMVDEENFKLLSGFNDIFVTIAGVLMLLAVAWLGAAIGPVVGAAAVAATAWGLAEYFTRVRRMALPSILFLLSFVGGVFSAIMGLFDATLAFSGTSTDPSGALVTAGAAAIAGGAAFVHWRRFHVPITVAAGAVAVVGVVASLVLSVAPDTRLFVLPLLFGMGCGVFAFAMSWDISDRERMTRRSDVAFWLHLVAAPMIAHPIFAMLGLLDGEASVTEALVVIALYVAMGIVALAIDRRALLVSALGYVLYALGALFTEFGAVGLSVALTALVIGSALLLLSAAWQSIRASVILRLPTGWADRLPPVAVLKPV